MANNPVNNDKILKVFSNIRCLNRDQLPRYLDGRLTDVEKHLVEQHLVDCDLCNEALHVLQQPQYRDKYQSLSISIQQYIRNSIKQVSHVQKAERYQRKEQKKESLLIYFWVVAAIALTAGGIYLIQQESRFKAQAPKPLASAGDLKAIPASSTASIPAKHDTVTVAPAVLPPPPPPVVEKENVVKPVVKKDSLKLKDSLKVKAAPVTKPVVKTDTAVKKVSAAAKSPEDKKDDSAVKKTAVPKDTPPVKKEPLPVKKEEPKAAPKAKDDDNKKTVTKVAASSETISTDEFLYKAAMVYHQQGDLNEAISRYKHLATSNSRYGELARYQLAVCYRSKGQIGKARRMFKEVVDMNGSMKDKAQAALDNL